MAVDALRQTAEPASARSLRIWIDLANSPHVPFFVPIIEELERRGHVVVLTARDFAQTVQLVSLAGLRADVIGVHGGKGLWRKASSIAGRARELAAWAKGRHIDLSVHHNSYAHSVASVLAGVPSVALMDYEHQPANHIAFRLSTKVLTPAAIPVERLRRFGVGRRLVQYDGLKEEVYLRVWDRWGRDLRPELGIAGDEPVIVFRPAPELAAYHRFENPLSDALVGYLSRIDATTIVLPRTAEQGRRLAGLASGNVRVSTEAIAPWDLAALADTVVSAGGTMAREAAVMGVPAYSMFAGERGAVDEFLLRDGRLTEIRSEDDFSRMTIERRPVSHSIDYSRCDLLVQALADEITETAR